MAKGKGYRRDPHGHTRAPFSAFAFRSGFADTTPPDEADLKDCLLTPFDQGGIGACLPHARVGGIWVAFAAAGRTLPWVPSQVDLYRLGRDLERAHDNPDVPANLLPPLRDIGTQPMWLDIAINYWGVRPMSVASVQDPKDPAPRYSDCDLTTVNVDPPLEDLISDAQTLLTGQFAIMGNQSQRGLAVRRSIGIERAAVEIGGLVDTKYENWTPSDGVYNLVDEHDPNGGGHGQLIVAYKKDPTLGWIYKIRNSWGADWCDLGDIWVREAFLGQAWALTALTVMELP